MVIFSEDSAVYLGCSFVYPLYAPLVSLLSFESGNSKFVLGGLIFDINVVFYFYFQCKSPLDLGKYFYFSSYKEAFTLLLFFT